MGASAPSCGLRYFGIDRQRVLELLQMGGERLQLLRLGFVANRDERFERRLGVEPLVLVDLVRADGRLDRRRRAPSTRRRWRSSRSMRNASARAVRNFFSVGCAVSSAASRSSAAARAELALVLDAVGNRATNPPGRPLRRMVVKKPVARAFASPVSASSQRLDVLLRRAGRIEVARFGLRRRAGDERPGCDRAATTAPC